MAEVSLVWYPLTEMITEKGRWSGQRNKLYTRCVPTPTTWAKLRIFLHPWGSGVKSDLKEMFVEATWSWGGKGSFVKGICFMLAHIDLLIMDFMFSIPFLGHFYRSCYASHSWWQLSKHKPSPKWPPAPLNSHAPESEIFWVCYECLLG